MEIYQLELFLAVAAAGSLTRAARERGLSTGAMSQQLQRLSVDLGVALFAKSGRGIALTPEGLQFADRARALLREVDDLRSSFSRDAKVDRSPFHLATGATTLIHGLSKPLRSLRNRYPEADLRITVANTEEMVEGLLRRRFDLAIISLPIEDDRLSVAPLYEEELLVLRPTDQPIYGWRVGTISATALEGMPWLLYPKDSNMRQLMDRHFERLGITPDVSMEAADTEVIVRLVEAGFGQSMLPAYALRRSTRNYRVFRLSEGRLFRRQAVAALRASSRPLTMAITKFLVENLR
jgi:DNA-binding transcriptional LysR family regulator